MKPSTLVPLSKLITLQRGFDLPEANRKEGDVPVVASTTIAGYHNEIRVSAPGVVIGRSGSIGGGQYITQDFWPLNTTLWVKDFKGHDPRFIYYLLRSIDFTRFNAGAGVPTLNRNHLDSLQVASFDAPTERRIAQVLSAYDDLIENNRRRIALLEQAARLLYREWFVHLRFPGREHIKVMDGVPEGWGVGCLSDCANVEDGDWIESKDQGGDDYRLLQVSNVGVDSFVETGNFRFVTAETFRRLNCREVVLGQILVSRMPDPIGRAWLVTRMPWKMMTAVDVAIVEPKTDRVTPHYLVQHLNSPKNLELSKQHATGATRLRIARRSLCALPVLIPPLALQRSFSKLIEDGYRMRSNLDSQIGRLTEARDLLLPRLMSGELVV